MDHLWRIHFLWRSLLLAAFHLHVGCFIQLADVFWVRFLWLKVTVLVTAHSCREKRRLLKCPRAGMCTKTHSCGETVSVISLGQFLWHCWRTEGLLLSWLSEEHGLCGDQTNCGNGKKPSFYSTSLFSNRNLFVNNSLFAVFNLLRKRKLFGFISVFCLIRCNNRLWILLR